MDPSFVDGRPGAPGGLSYTWDLTGAGTLFYRAMGPLPGGRVLSRLFWAIGALTGANITYRLGLCLAGSGGPTLENFRAGSSLFRGSPMSTVDRPAVTRLMSARALDWGMMWPGLELREGSRWLLLAFAKGGGGEASVRVSVEFVWPGWYGGQFAAREGPPAEPAE